MKNPTSPFMSFLFSFALFLSGCNHPNSDLEAIAEDVLDAEQGIDIEIRPIPKGKK